MFALRHYSTLPPHFLQCDWPFETEAIIKLLERGQKSCQINRKFASCNGSAQSTVTFAQKILHFNVKEKTVERNQILEVSS